MRTKLITAVIIVLFASLAIYSYTTQENKLQLQNIELKNRETKLKSLDLKYRTLNTELDKLKSDKNASDEQVKKLEEQRQQLEKEKQDLSSQLQAKIEAKSKLAQASQKVVNTVTQTQTASAAPVSSNEAKMFIYNKESGNRTDAVNSTGCRGLGQACPGSKLPCTNYDYACQDAWFTNYMIQMYGS